MGGLPAFLWALLLIGTLLCAWIASIGLLERGSSERLIYAGVVLALSAFVLSRGRTLQLPSRRVVTAGVILLVWPFASALWSGYPPAAIFRGLKWSLAIGSFLLLFQVHRKQLVSLTARALAVAICLAVAYAVVERAISGRTWAQVGGLFRHANLFGSWLMVGMFPLAAGISQARGVWKWLMIVALLAGTVLLGLLGVRTAWVGVLIGTAVSAGCWLCHSGTRRTSLRILLLMLAPAAIVGWLLTQHADWSNTASMDERLALWSNTLDVIKEQPLVGVGAGNWQFEYLKHGVQGIPAVATGNTSFQTPHNDYLWITSEMGIPFAALLVFATGWLVVQTLRNRRLETAKQWMESGCYLGAIAAWSVAAMFSFPSDRVLHLLTMAAICAVLVKRFDRVRFGHAQYAWLAFAFAGASIVFGVCQARGEWFTRQIIVHKASEEYFKLPELCDRAQSVVYRVDPMSTPLSSYRLLAYIGKPRMHERRLELVREAYALSPYDHEVLSNLGVELMVGGKHTEAETYLREAVRLNPRHQPAWFNLALVYFHLGQHEQSMQCLTYVPEGTEKFTRYIQRINR